MSETEKKLKKGSELDENNNLKSRILSICEPMCLKVLKEKPENISNYMLNYLMNKYNYTSTLLSKIQKKELIQLKEDLELFHGQEENFYYMESYHKQKKEVRSPDKKNKNIQKHKQRLPPDEIIPSDDEDYNIPEEIDDNLDNITYIKERANQEKRTDLFEIKENTNEFFNIKYNKKSEDIFNFLKVNLLKSPLFSELPIDILTKCINAMNEENHNSMSEIVKQGEYSDKFYIILSGELECRLGFTIPRKEGNRTFIDKYEPKLVKVYYPGDYFCELNLLYHMPLRGSIKSLTDTILYTIDRKTYKYILNSSYIEKNNNKIELFKNIPIFNTFTEEEFEKLSRISKEVIYCKGETIIKENEYMNTLMIIEKGKCCGYKIVEKGKLPKKTKEYKEQDFFGKTALLKEEISEESIIATSNFVKLICLDRNSIKNIFGSLESILMRDIDVYEKYFPPIPDYSEQEKDIQKDLLGSFEGGENSGLNNNNVNVQNSEKSKILTNNISNNNDNTNNINIQSRNLDKNINFPQEGISKKISKDKEEMYESEIKRLKDEISLLKSKMNNKSEPEFNNNSNNFIEKKNSEKEINLFNNNNYMENNEIYHNQNLNNTNNNNNNINENEKMNNDNNINNDNIENINIGEDINKDERNNNFEKNKSIEIEELVETNRNDKLRNQNEKKEEINAQNNQIESNIFNSENNNLNNLSNNNNKNFNNNFDEPNNKKNNIQTDFFRGIRKRNQFTNLTNLEIDDMNNSIGKRTVNNKSGKNMDFFQIENFN